MTVALASCVGCSAAAQNLVLLVSYPEQRMFEQIAVRATFWSAIAFLVVASGVASFDALGITVGNITAGQMAPFLSLAALTVAIVGWRLLHGEINRLQSDKASLRDRIRRLDDAMYASAEGVVLLRAQRNIHGDVFDFEITDINPSGAALLRDTRTALVGRLLRRDLASRLDVNTVDRYITTMTTKRALVEEVRVHPRRFSAGWLSHNAVPTADGLAVTIQDISARKREEIRLRRASLTDDLTQLYNRRGFLTLAEQQLRVARRQGKDVVLLYVDLDDFKKLNDQFGHAEGDRALIAVSRLLRRTVRDCDIVARMGGDEFTMLAIDADGAAARIIQRRIEERVAQFNATHELQGTLALTIGHTRVRCTDHSPLIELLARADTLLYARKKRRKLTAAVTARAASHPTARVPRLRAASVTTNVTSPDFTTISHGAVHTSALDHT